MKKFLPFLLAVIPLGFANAQQGLEFLGIDKSTPIGDVFEKIFFFGLSLVGLAALVMLVFGGTMYLTAGDSSDQTKRARGMMSNAIFGVALAFLSWLILFTINPDIVQQLKLAPTKLEPPKGTQFTFGNTVVQGVENINNATPHQIQVEQERCRLEGCVVTVEGLGTSGIQRLTAENMNKEQLAITIREQQQCQAKTSKRPLKYSITPEFAKNLGLPESVVSINYCSAPYK